MRMIMMKEVVMILREGQLGSIVIMMKVIIVAIYLSGADVVARPRPSWLSLVTPNYLHIRHIHACSDRSFIGSLPQEDILQDN